MALRSKYAVLLAKVESTPGTDASPTAGSNAVKVENPRFVATPDITQTNEVNASLDMDEPIVGGVKANLQFDVYLVGSGTPETPPDWGALLKGCGWAETITSTAVPSSAEACGSGAATTTATLGSSATGTANLYTGMPIEFTSNQTLSSFIASYTAAKLATLTDTAGGNITTTSNYQIPKNVVYRPASASASVPALTIWLYKDGKLYKATGCRGTFNFTLTAAGTGKFSFTFSGQWTTTTDAAIVSPTYMSNGTKSLWYGGKSRWNRIAMQCRSFTLDNGNSVFYPDDPEATYGFGPAEITSREIKGTVDPLETLKATRDIQADMVAGTKRILHVRTGSVAGNRFGITLPQAMATADDHSQDRDGMAVEAISFRGIGADLGACICQY